MPEYKLPGKTTPEFTDLPAFARGYIEAAFFTAPDEAPDMSDVGFSDLDPDTLADILSDCAAFQEENKGLINALIENGGPKGAYDEEAAGRDYWFTRNGHGVGYWDRGFTGPHEAIAQKLSEAAEKQGTKDLDLSDEGTVFTM